MTETSESNLSEYYFHQGTNYRAYEYLGVHLQRTESLFIYSFRVWAPNAESVSLTGDFNNWNINCSMKKITRMGVWEYILESDICLDGNKYKYYVFKNGKGVFKSDPYAVYSESLSKNASIIHTLSEFEWNDFGWLKYRKNIFDSYKSFYPAPMNIYELHLGSWKTRNGKTTKYGDCYLTYREIADDLVKYVKHMGFTHVELLPVAEHPYDGSWGYQICSFYAPSSRYGTPEDFMYFVNTLHINGVGVILDWVLAHFPKDENGLYEFDGTRLYEYQGDDRTEHKGWGTRCFDVGRNEVQSFLISNALYWFREYHIDGLRCDAVASMLYLDYDRKPGEWIPNRFGGNINTEAVCFLKKLNKAVFGEFTDVLMIAEESTAFPKITHPVHEGGLGFNLKWNMGWANDSFDYISLEPYFRQFNHNKLTFPVMYAYSENYILPVSHDEVVHGKKTLLDKCSGKYEDKFSTCRAFLIYMMTFPGKKLMFMGQEYGQFREWDYQNQLEWFMCDFEMHRKMKEFVCELNNLYLERKELWELDFSTYGFEWIYADYAQLNTLAYKRRDIDGKELIICINFSDIAHFGFEISCGCTGFNLLFSSDDIKYGGSGKTSIRRKNTETIEADISPFSGFILEINGNNRNGAKQCLTEKNALR